MSRIPKVVRDKCFEDFSIKFHNESFRFKCPTGCCNNEVSPFNFEAGHICSVASGGSHRPDNLIPICNKCNKSMGTNNMITWLNMQGITPYWKRDIVNNASINIAKSCCVFEHKFDNYVIGFSDFRQRKLIIENNTIESELVVFEYPDLDGFNFHLLNKINLLNRTLRSAQTFEIINFEQVDMNTKFSFELFYILLDQFKNDREICPLNFLENIDEPIYTSTSQLLLAFMREDMKSEKPVIIGTCNEFEVFKKIINGKKITNYQRSSLLHMDIGDEEKHLQLFVARFK